MKHLPKVISIIGLLIMAVSTITVTACRTTYDTGQLQGGVTIGPVFPGPEQPGDSRPVPPEVFAARKVMVYDESGKTLLWQVDINQINQGVTGYYSILLKPGTYIVDINHVGIDRSGNVPQKITIKEGQTITINLDIDTGIR